MNIEALKQKIRKLTTERISATIVLETARKLKDDQGRAPAGSVGDREAARADREAYGAAAEELGAINTKLDQTKAALDFETRQLFRPVIEERLKQTREFGQQLVEAAAAVQECLEDLKLALPEIDRLSSELQRIERIDDPELRGVTGITGTLFHPTFRPSRLRLPLSLALRNSNYKGLVQDKTLGQPISKAQSNFQAAESQAVTTMIERLENQLSKLEGGVTDERHAKVG